MIEKAFLLLLTHICLSVVSNSLLPHGLHHARLPCPSPTTRDCSKSCQSSWWCHPTISSSVVPFSSCLQSFPALGSFPMIQFFASGSKNTGASALASVLPMNIQDWSLGWTARQQEKPLREEAHIPEIKASLHSLQLEKTCSNKDTVQAKINEQKQNKTPGP